MSFNEKLNQIINKTGSLLCVGLDPVLEKIPERFSKYSEPLYEFCKYIVDETHDSVCGYKPNSAFFEAYGADGIAQLKKLMDYIKASYPDLIVILDAKRGDIESTNHGYLKFAYDYLKADAVTLHPFLGKEAIKLFLDQKEKGCVILCRTSNNGSFELQNLVVQSDNSQSDNPNLALPLYEYIAKQVAQNWNENNNCMLVVGATQEYELGKIRKIVGDTPLLVPGIGAQGGDIEKTMKNGLNSQKSGLVIAISRGIIYASNPQQEARSYKNKINSFI
jgi:orotidine-5'-phosphate decarboxylase